MAVRPTSPCRLRSSGGGKRAIATVPSSGYEDVEAALAAVRAAPAGSASPASANQRGEPLGKGVFFDAEPPGSGPQRGARQSGGNGMAVNRYDRYDDGAPEDGYEPTFDGGEGFEDARSAGRAATIIGWLAFLLALGGLGAGAWLKSEEVVRQLPGAAPLYALAGSPVNIRGLEFTGLQTKWQLDQRGRPVLGISGQVKNISQAPRPVPSVVFAFRDDDGLELFDWATPMRSDPLPPGETQEFISVVPVPPEAVRHVEVRFATATR